MLVFIITNRCKRIIGCKNLMSGEIIKTELQEIFRFSIQMLKIILYIVIQTGFIPFVIVGIIVGMYKGMGKSKKLGISFTACRALQYRWFMHYFDTRPDPLSVAFIKNFPCESHFGLWSFMGPLIISQRCFGFTTKLGKIPRPGKETLVSMVARRLLMFDEIMEKYVDEMEQIVIPGSGFDLIALHFTKGKKVKVFELDQVKTLNCKVKTLKQTDIQHDWITYIPVDYASESWCEKLLTAGFDIEKKTLFIWQSVSLYLDVDLVKETLEKMADLCGDGSVIAQDFYSKAYISGEISKTVQRTSRLMGRLGEPWKFGIDMSNNPQVAVASFLKECGLKMSKINMFGEKLSTEPFYCIVEARKEP